MALDLFRLVRFVVPEKAPTVVLNLNDGVTYFKERGTLKVTPPSRNQQTTSASNRYGGASVVNESLDNGTLTWTMVVKGTTPDLALANAETLVQAFESFAVGAQGEYIEFRPQGATSPVYYDIRGPASTSWDYESQRFAGGNLTKIELSVPVAPLALLPRMDILDDFTRADDVAVSTNLLKNPSLETGTSTFGQLVNNPINGIRNPQLGTNATDWNAFISSGTSATGARITTDGWIGANCYENVGIGLAANSFIETYLSDAAGPALAVTPGDQVFLSVAVKASVQAATSQRIEMLARTLTSGFASNESVPTGGFSIVASPVTGRWYVLSGWFTIPAGAAYVTPSVHLLSNASTGGAYTLRVSNMMAVKVSSTSVGANYIDGTMPGAVWLGTAHASQSRQDSQVNSCKNPSFEVDTSGYGSLYVSSAVRSTARAFTGTASCLLTANATVGFSPRIEYNNGSGVNGPKVVPGMQVTATARVYTGTAGRYAALGFLMRDAVGSDIAYPTSGATALVQNGWTVLTHTATVQAGVATTAFQVIYGVTSGNAEQTIPNGEQFNVDSFQLTATPAAVDYFDGASMGGVWNATANASESVLAGLTRVSGAGSSGSSAVLRGALYGRITQQITLGGNLGVNINNVTGIVGGQPYAFSFDLYLVSVTAGVTARAYVDWYGSGGGYLGTMSGPTYSTIGAVTRLSVTDNAPAGAVSCTANVLMQASGGALVDAAVDSFLFVKGTSTTYFDGDMLLSDWTGTAHASTSSLYADDGLNDYSWDAGDGTLKMSRATGQLVPLSTVMKSLYHSARGYAYGDVQVTLKYTTGASPAGVETFCLGRRQSNGDCLWAKTQLDYVVVGKRIAGVNINLNSSPFLANLAANSTYWVRLRIEGNILTGEHWIVPPTPTAQPTVTISQVLTTAEAALFGAAITGGVGMSLVAPGTDWRYDDFVVEPYTYRNRVLPDVIALGGAIPGTAPALADVALTTSSNFITNPTLDANTTGWSVAAVAGRSAAATSITSLTADYFSGGASGKVIAPGTAAQEGTNYSITTPSGARVFSSGVEYRWRVRVKSLSGSTALLAKLADAAGDGDSVAINFVASTSAWTTVEGAWTPSADRSAVAFYVLTVGTTAATFWIDNAEVWGPSVTNAVVNTSGAPAWGLLAWAQRPGASNMIWNGDFETDVAGWRITSMEVNNAPTSLVRNATVGNAKYGSAVGEFVCPATANTGPEFKIYKLFKAGVTYTATAWARTTATANTFQAALWGQGGTDSAQGATITLTTAWQQVTVAWTPTADRVYAVFAPRTLAATALTVQIDGVMVYEGVVPPTIGKHAEGAGAEVLPAVIEAEAGDSFSASWFFANLDPGATRGNYKTYDSVVSGAEAYAATWLIDPSFLSADQFTRGEADVEVWGRFILSDTVIFPRVVLSARPEAGVFFGAERFTNEFGTIGKLIVKPLAGWTPWRMVRLGTLTLPVGQAGRWRLRITATTQTGSTGAFGLDYLIAAPVTGRVAGPTGKALDATYPRLMTSAAETTRVTTSDLRGYASQPPGQLTQTAGAMGGPLIELPVGNVNVLAKLSTLVPDDPTVDSTNEPLAHLTTVHVSVQPRVFITRGT